MGKVNREENCRNFNHLSKSDNENGWIQYLRELLQNYLPCYNVNKLRIRCIIEFLKCSLKCAKDIDAKC